MIVFQDFVMVFAVYQEPPPYGFWWFFNRQGLAKTTCWGFQVEDLRFPGDPKQKTQKDS